jgi:histone deacetylase 6
MFWKDPSVLYFSVHRYDNGRFFPGTGSPEGVGEGEGEGYTMNVGWNEGGMGDREYREVWRKVLLPVARAFGPGLILVSAGFDGSRGDGMGGCEVTGEGGFGWMTRQLVKGVESAQGRVVLALEGGYRLSVLGECVEACLGGLMGEGGEEEEEEEEEEKKGEIREEAVEAIERTMAAHRKYWPCLGGGGGAA